MPEDSQPSRIGKRLVVVPSDPIAAYEAAGYDWLERYYNPCGAFEEVYALSPLESGEREAHGMTIRHVPEPQFAHALRELKPDVVRAYGGYWPADLVCGHRVPGVPVVVSVHDTLPSNVHRSLRYADLVICMSRAVAEQVEKVGTDPARIRILPNRVDLDLFRPVQNAQLFQPLDERFPPGKRLLHIGRKTEQKNLDTCIRALPHLPEDYYFIFVGKGDKTPYQALAGELGVAARCHWVEAIQNAELPLWYSWCDCMCTPSRWEGFGIVFIEAAACGAAIVTSAIAPMNEYLTHGISAHLVAGYENAEEVAQAVRKVCEDAEYKQRLQAGAQEAAQPFDRRQVDAQEVAIYREAMSLGPPTPERQQEIESWQRRARMVNRLKHSWPGLLARAVNRRLRGR